MDNLWRPWDTQKYGDLWIKLNCRLIIRKMFSAPRLVGPRGHNKLQVQSSVHVTKTEAFISCWVGFGQDTDATTRGRQKLDPHRAQSSFVLPRAPFGKENVIDVPCMARPVWWVIRVAGVIIDKSQLSCFTSENFIQRQIQPHPRWLPLRVHDTKPVFHFPQVQGTARLSEARGRMPWCWAWTGSSN